MFTKPLLFVETFESEFKGNKYSISMFVDTQSLTLLSATDIKTDFELKEGTCYNCVIEPKGSKFKVIQVKEVK